MWHQIGCQLVKFIYLSYDICCSSHLVTVSPGPILSDALVSSPVVVGEDGVAPPVGGGGFDPFGVDPNEDPELALASILNLNIHR